MHFVDTHTHLYVEEFNADRNEVVQRAIEENVSQMIVPAIDSHTHKDLLDLCGKYPENLFPAMGLHPTSVDARFEEQLAIVEDYLRTSKFYAIGETGIDLYWDTTFEEQQVEVFKWHIALAKKYKLPIIIHVRNSYDKVIGVLKTISLDGICGVFHCFPGNVNQAAEVIEMGFKIGINGVVTFKNAEMAKVVEHVALEHILLETDSPYLAPVPKRGKRNESSYIRYIAQKIADLKEITVDEVVNATQHNAQKLFKLPKLN